MAAPVWQVTVVGEAPQPYSSATIPIGRVAGFYAACFGVLGVVLPFLGPYLQVRGISPVGIGLITAAFSLARLVYTPFLGLLVDRGVWFRGLLPVHVALALAGTAMLVMGAGPWLLGVALLVIGLGYGSVLPLVEAAVLERLPASATVPCGCGGRSVSSWWRRRPGGFAGERLPLFPPFAGGLLALGVTCWHLDAEARPSCSRSACLPPIAWGCWRYTVTRSHGPYYAFFSVHLRKRGSPASPSAPQVGRRGRRAGRVPGEPASRSPARAAASARAGPRADSAADPALPTNLPCWWRSGHAATFARAPRRSPAQQRRPAGATRHAQALYSLSFVSG
jgi:hypothetical protein